MIGLGNEHRHDDRCGLEVVRRLEGRGLEGLRLLEAPRDAARMLHLWEGAEEVIVIDAMYGNGRPGSVRRFEVARGDRFGSTPATSTHGLGLAEAVEIARSLGRLPPRLTVFGIEAADLGVGDGLSPEVEKAVTLVTDEVAREAVGIGEAASDPSPGGPCTKRRSSGT